MAPTPVDMQEDPGVAGGVPQVLMVTFLTFADRRRNANCAHSLLVRPAFAQFGGTGEAQMDYVLLLACLWSAVGALVFFVRANITLRQRLVLTIGTSLVFGVVGWFDVASIFHDARSNPPAMAKELVRPDIRSSTATN